MNGKEYIFRNGIGYIEGDRGCSFPEKYLWTQYSNSRLSIFMAAASIPVCRNQFNGCIACVWHKGKELRLATYLGARITYADSRKLVLHQKDLILSAELLDRQPQAHHLLTPKCGGMSRCTGEIKWTSISIVKEFIVFIGTVPCSKFRISFLTPF